MKVAQRKSVAEKKINVPRQNIVEEVLGHMWPVSLLEAITDFQFLNAVRASSAR